MQHSAQFTNTVPYFLIFVLGNQGPMSPSSLRDYVLVTWTIAGRMIAPQMIVPVPWLIQLDK